jgi:hypothetical protein
MYMMEFGFMCFRCTEGPMNRFTPPQPDYFQEYRRLKQQFPDSLLLIRMGKFYEAFCEDAEVVARICRTRLWQLRDGAAAGLPEIYIETHRQRLVAFGCQVVFAEEVDGRFHVTGPPDSSHVVPVRSRKPARRKRRKTRPGVRNLGTAAPGTGDTPDFSLAPVLRGEGRGEGFRGNVHVQGTSKSQ